MSAPQTEPPVVTGAPVTARWRQVVQQLMALAGLIVIFAAFSFIKPDIFPTGSNIESILFSAVVWGLLGLGQMLCIVTAGIDLSVGTGMALSAVMSATFIVTFGWPWWLGVLAAIAFGGLIGVVNGLNVAYLGLPPFIATLAMMMICQGLALVVSQAHPIYFDKAAHAGYIGLSTGKLIPGVSNAVVILLLATAIAYVIFNKTLLGRYDVSIGSNREATALSGINVKKWLVAIYATAGCFTGLAGILISARLGSAQPATGAGYEMYAIAAAVIGGTSLAGGKGSVPGTLIGAVIISTIYMGLRVIGVPQEWQSVILGLVILATVFMDQLRNARSTT